MDDEAAEIELLEQNLNKTRRISQRMTSILANFDTRLAKLEKSIQPLHASTILLNRRAAHIDLTLQRIEDVSNNDDGLVSEEALILRGPQVTQLNAYMEALERINANIAFKGSQSDSRSTARLVEAGTRKLTQLYTTLVAEASSGDPPYMFPLQPGLRVDPSALVPFPRPIATEISTLVSFLRTLPLPATHPSHPAAAQVLSALLEAQRGYADMRGSWAKRCLESGVRLATEGESGRADESVRAGLEFAQWVVTLLDVVENEYTFLAEMALVTSPSQLQTSFSSLLMPLYELLTNALSQLTTRVKRALHRHTFLALATYSRLTESGIQRRWEEAVKRSGSKDNGPINPSAVREGLHALRAVCLRSFPEFLADIKLGAVPRSPGEIGTGIADITETVVRYLEAIPAVQDAVASALLTLGDGNWKMGEGMQVKQGPKLVEGDESVVLEHYLYDIIMTTLSTLTTLSRTSRRPAIGAIFLLNNVSHLSTAVLNPSDPTFAPVDALLAPPAIAALQSAARTAKAGYFEANFSPLLQTLGDGPGGGKAATKEKFNKFFELLEEIIERHRGCRVLPEDDIGREALAEEAVKLVVPSLQRFIQKNREKEFSKNPQKYIKMPPEEVERQIRGLY